MTSGGTTDFPLLRIDTLTKRFGGFRTEPSTVIFGGEDITRLPPHLRTRRGIARSFQIPRPFKSMTVVENLMVALDFTSATHLRLSAADHRDSAMAILH